MKGHHNCQTGNRNIELKIGETSEFEILAYCKRHANLVGTEAMKQDRPE